MAEQTTLNTSLQNEINSLKQKIAEGNATNNSLKENLKSQKELNQNKQTH